MELGFPLDRWPEVDRLFAAALDLPAEAREAHVAEACGDDAELRAAVLGLLRAEGRSHALLDAPPVGPLLEALAGDAAASDSAAPARIGRFRVVGEIGRGGWGTVYLAERDAGDFEQRVAIKVLRRGLDTDDVLARFRAEGRILGALSHPNIARLFDAGATEDGRPYLVMELVEGEPITAYVETRQLGVAERLRLFAAAGRAVEYAHRNLVVHRDLKPSNLLVTAEGEVKLLDFGIAKLLLDEDDAALGAVTPRTRTGVRPMTPEYASPEQVLGDPITTASDVYQLGLLLYELLTGRRPHTAADSAPHRLEQRVTRDTPLPPSAAVQRSTAPAPSRRKWGRALRGDLDTIVLKALRKEPERRYASVAELVDDIERHLDGRPVLARPDRWTYRAGKLARRHPGVVAAGVAALLAGGAYVGTLQAHAERLQHERNVAHEERGRAENALLLTEEARSRAQAERIRAEAAQHVAETARNLAQEEQERAELALQRARLETAKSTQVTDFLVDLFKASDPAVARGDEVTARELLERGVAQVNDLPADPEVRAELLSVMTRVHLSLGLYREALPLATRAVQLQREQLGSQHVKVAEALNDLSNALWYSGDLPAAEATHREALAIRRRQLGSDHADAAESLTGLGVVLRGRGDLPGAEAAHREALAIRRKRLGSGAPDVARSLNNLAVVLRARGDHAGAEAAHEEAIAIFRKLLGPYHPDVARSLVNLAIARRSRGNLDGAIAAYREALPPLREQLGAEHPDIAQVLTNFGVALQEHGDLAEAEAAHREALAIWRKQLRAGHPLIAVGWSNLGGVLQERGDLAGAEAAHREAVAIRREALAADHPSLALSLSNLAEVLRERGDLDGAEAAAREALAMRRRRLGDQHADVAQSVSELGEVLRLRSDLPAAEEHQRRALAIWRAQKASDTASRGVAATMIRLGRVLEAKGAVDDAERLYLDGIAIQEELLGRDHATTLASRMHLDRLLHARGRGPLGRSPH
jgi:serine/threonine-protein kinase